MVSKISGKPQIHPKPKTPNCVVPEVGVPCLGPANLRGPGVSEPWPNLFLGFRAAFGFTMPMVTIILGLGFRVYSIGWVHKANDSNNNGL